MTITEFIRRKNEIIERATGIILVPEDQIVEVQMPIQLSMAGDAAACPYCHLYLLKKRECIGCPMSKASNQCEFDGDNTYDKVYSALGTNITSPISEVHGELAALIYQFNSELLAERGWVGCSN
jgi:hypothetical protein